MLIAHRKISPLLLALPVLAAIAAAVALRGGDTSTPRSHHVAPARSPSRTPRHARSTTPQLVARYRAEAAAKPRSAQAVDNLALAELQMAREDGDPTWYTRADALFAHALALAPDDFTALAGRGSLALSRHDFAGGLALGRRALAIDPSNPFAMGVVVDANVELGRYGAARSAIERLLRQRPDLASYSRASYYLELHGRTGAARKALVQATQAGAPSGENTAWAYLYLGNLEFNHGRYAAAEANYGIALHTYPGFVHARAAQAKLAAARGQYAKCDRRLHRRRQAVPAPGVRHRARRRLPGSRQARRGPAPVLARPRRGAALRGQRRERRRRARALRRRPQRGRGRRARPDPGRRPHPAERHRRGRPRVDALQGRPRPRGAGRVEPGASPRHAATRASSTTAVRSRRRSAWPPRRPETSGLRSA